MAPPLDPASDDGPLGLSGSTLLIAQAISFVGFASLNIGLNFYNSFLLTAHTITVNVTVGEGRNATVEEQTYVPDAPVNGAPNLDFPVFYTMWHMVASVLGATVILLFIAKPETGFPNYRQFVQYGWQLLAISICTTLNIALNNVSLSLISLFLNQVIKATGPLPTMLFCYLLEKKTYGLPMILSCAAIVGATILAVPISGGGPPTSGVGVVIVIISTLAATLKPVIMGMVMKGTPERPKLPPTVVLFYDVFLSFWIMLVYWLCSAERQASINYLSHDGAYAVGLILAGATMAFGFNLTNYFFVLLTSALTVTIAGNGVKVINIVISALISHISAVSNWVGVALVCVALCAYAYFSHTAKRGGGAMQLPKLPLLSKADPEARKATEGTPLKSDAPEGEGKCCVIL